MKELHSLVEDRKAIRTASGVCGHASPLHQVNFAKVDPKSCNLSELKVILLNWKKTFLGGRIFFMCIPPSDLSTRTPIPEIWF